MFAWATPSQFCVSAAGETRTERDIRRRSSKCPARPGRRPAPSHRASWLTTARCPRRTQPRPTPVLPHRAMARTSGDPSSRGATPCGRRTPRAAASPRRTCPWSTRCRTTAPRTSVVCLRGARVLENGDLSLWLELVFGAPPLPGEEAAGDLRRRIRIRMTADARVAYELGFVDPWGAARS